MNTTTRHAIVTTPIGDVTLVASGDALTGLYFPGHWYKPNEHSFGEKAPASSDTLLSVAERQLNEYLHGTRNAFELPTETHGDAFQERIWSLIKEIPFGETTTYGELAKKYGDRYLAREVGQAVGRNPLSVIVPCHRVVGKDGKLTGYAGGLPRKKALLELEGRRWRLQSSRADLRRLVLHGVSPAAASGR